MSMERYQHPPTFRATGDFASDSRAALEDYDTNVLPLLPPDRGARILDVGCGWGQFLWWLRSRGYDAAEGVDLGPEQIEQCRSLGLRAQRVDDSAEFLRSRPGEFDVITSHHVIEHMDGGAGLELLRAMHGALREGGRVVIQTPNMNAVCANYTRHIEMTHVTGYTDSSLAEILQVAGFVNVSVRGNVTPFALAPRRLLWLGLQFTSRFLWRVMLTSELGSDAPRVLSKNLHAVAYRSAPPSGRLPQGAGAHGGASPDR